VNVQLVRVGAAAPYFYFGRRASTRTCSNGSRFAPERGSWVCGDAATYPLRPEQRGQHEAVAFRDERFAVLGR
jgi:hypothetical protein